MEYRHGQKIFASITGTVLILYSISFIFQDMQPRERYRELLEVAVMFLGGTPPRETREAIFRRPETAESVRWMEPIISCFLIWMLKMQLPFKAAQIRNVERVLVFAVSPGETVVFGKRLKRYLFKGSATDQKAF
jgi:hypothetical protein